MRAIRIRVASGKKLKLVVTRRKQGRRARK